MTTRSDLFQFPLSLLGFGPIYRRAEKLEALAALGAAGVERAITLFPEWAEAVCVLGKTCENRGMRPPSTLPIGSLLAIHAGAHPAARVAPWRKRDVDQAAAAEGWEVEADGFRRDGILRPWAPTSSAIVAVARLYGVAEPGAKRAPWHFPGSWGWLLDDVQQLERPISCPGAQGLWKLSNVAERMKWRASVGGEKERTCDE